MAHLIKCHQNSKSWTPSWQSPPTSANIRHGVDEHLHPRPDARELIRRDQEAGRGLAELDAAVQLALADVETGRTKPAAEVLDRLSAKYAAMAEDERRR